MSTPDQDEDLLLARSRLTNFFVPFTSLTRAQRNVVMHEVSLMDSKGLLPKGWQKVVAQRRGVTTKMIYAHVIQVKGRLSNYFEKKMKNVAK